MDLESALPQIEKAVNAAFLAYLKQRFSDREFGMNSQGEITVDGLDVGLIRTEEAMSGEEEVAGHWRRLKNGGWKWIEGHTRAKKMPTAMELAQIEIQQENYPDVGFSVEGAVNEFIRTLSNPDSLKNYL